MKNIIIFSVALLIQSSCIEIIESDSFDSSTSSSGSSSSNDHNGLLFTAKLITKEGVPIYFGFEKIDESNVLFWKNYRYKAGTLASCLKMLPKFIQTGQLKKARGLKEEVLQYSDAEYEQFLNYIKNSPKNVGDYEDNLIRQYFTGVAGGFGGMDLGDTNPRNRLYYVIYASSQPIRRRYVNSDYDKNMSFEANFGKIIMSMTGITAPKVPTTTHTGIARNPMDFFKTDKKYAGISMKLHGFGAVIWKTKFKDKKFMITKPLESMADILKSKIDSNLIWLGTYPDELKKLERAGIDFDFSYPTENAVRTTVDLKSLSSFFNS